MNPDGKRWLIATIGACAAVAALPVRAADGGPLALSAEYVADGIVVADGPERGTNFVDLLTLEAGLDLDRATGWHGASLHATVLAGAGSQPNVRAGTLEGIDNAEVTRNRVRLFEAYLMQELPTPGLTAKLGFIDLNADFYATDSAGLLLAPPFGIGSELAATGPNGPSIFPSTAPTASLRYAPDAHVYVQAAVVSAEARVIGDIGGPAPLFDQGALLIAEAGTTDDKGKFAVGGWTYSKRQDDIGATATDGSPLHRRARGAYFLAEHALGSDRVTGFFRAGISDGTTSPFRGSWQAGVLVTGMVAARPTAVLSVGVHQGYLSSGYRTAMAATGDPQRPAETGWEVTLEDRLAPWLRIQPDLQFIRTTSRRPSSRDAVVLGLRLTFSAPGEP